MSGVDVAGYWQAYPDLLEIRARGFWSDEDLRAHFLLAGQAEGRRLVPAGEVPDDWSDWLYFANWPDDFEWWWRQGALPTGAFAALASGPDALAAGRMAESSRLADLARLSGPERAALAAHARAAPGSGPLRDLALGPLRWPDPPAGHLLALLDRLAAEGPPPGLPVLLALADEDGPPPGRDALAAALAAGMPGAFRVTEGEEAPRTPGAPAPLALGALYRSAFGTDWAALPAPLRTEVLVALVAALAPERLVLLGGEAGLRALAAPHAAPRLRAAAGTIEVALDAPFRDEAGRVRGSFRILPALVPLTERFVVAGAETRDLLASRFAIDPRTVRLAGPAAHAP